jgi:hypothetical protein
MEPGLRSEEKLADDAHGPVLQIYKKQNRELSYEVCVRASRTRQDKIGR